MSKTATKQVIITRGQRTINVQFNESADGDGGREITLPVGVAGTLTTRTDDDTGIATLGTGHGITDSDTVDVYWNSGANVRYGMDVTAYDGTTVTLDGGAGDVLPAQDTAVVVTIQVEIDFVLDGDDLVAMVIESSQIAHLDFQESDTTSIYATLIDTATSSSSYYEDWFYSSGVSNPWTGNPMASIFASNSSSSAAAALTLDWVLDTTP